MLIQKNRNIFSKILILLIILTNLVYCDPPNWDENGDGVLDNYNDYENNGSVTAKVYSDSQDYSELGDMIAAFVQGEQRGVGLASVVPPFLGEGIAYLTMLYSNESSGEMLSFQYYDQSADILYYIDDTLEFTTNMVVGDVIDPLVLNLSENNIPDSPDWDLNDDGVLDNYNDYENNGSITSMVTTDGINSYADNGDMIAAFVLGEQRGVGLSSEVPFGPYQGTFQFQMMIYSNETSNETITFQYYDASSGNIYDLLESFEFTTNMIVGNVTAPFIFTFNEDTSNNIYGCTDIVACNYDSEANANDGSCTYPEQNLDCNGNCTIDLDCNGICGGSGIIIDEECCISGETDICGLCDGDNSTCAGCMDMIACNYDESAIINDSSCEYPESDFDCAGNCLVFIDCNGICGGSSVLDECGECNGNGIGDGECDCDGNLLDCYGECAGDAYIDNCETCVEGNTNLNPCQSFNYDVSLHVGANLISFYALPIDNNLSNMLISNTNDFLYAITGLTNSAINLGNNIWEGSLNSISKTQGYWFKTINTMSLSLDEVWNINDNLEYNLSVGSNLVSLPTNQSFDLDSIISNEFESSFDAIIGESLIAIKLEDGTWIGSLSMLSGGKGYYFIMNESIDFTYELGQGFSRSTQQSPVNNLCNQSSNQAFYILDNNRLNLEIGDAILSLNNNIIVGSRIVNSRWIDVPVMGDDDSFSTSGYCHNSDSPTFKIKKLSGEIIDLFGNVPTFENNKISFIDLTTSISNELPTRTNISNLYPNPFNPTITFNIDILNKGIYDISIFDIKGRKIDDLHSDYLESGSYDFQWNASKFTSGIYFVKLQNSNLVLSKKITLIK